MGKLGVTRLHVSFVLNHSVPGVTGVYDLYEYLAEKTRVLDLWGARLRRSSRTMSSSPSKPRGGCDDDPQTAEVVRPVAR